MSGDAAELHNQHRSIAVSDNARQEYIDKLGRDFGNMLCDVHEEWTLALDRYQELMELFGDEKQVAILNAVGGTFFGDIQQVLSNDLILRLTRLVPVRKLVNRCHHWRNRDRRTVDRVEWGRASGYL